MASEKWNVDVQGTTPDLMQANGSYDAIEFKDVSPRRLAEMLLIVSRLSPPGDDVCPPSVIIHGPRGDHTFTVFDNSGQLFCVEPEGAVSIEQAVLIVTGKPVDFAIPVEKKSSPSAGPRLCGNCQAEIEAGEAFCGGCGQSVTTAAPSVPSQMSAHAAKGSGKKPAIAQETYDAILALMAKPLSLTEYREKYPYLLHGPKGEPFRQVIDAMFRTDPPAAVHARLTQPPRDWGIRKPGIFRRLLTLIIDFPLLLVLIVVGVNLGKVTGIDPDSLMAGIFAFSWFFAAFVGYYAVSEVILGASLGGLLMGLRVVDDYGNSPTIGLCVTRQLWKIFSVLGILASLRRNPNMPISAGPGIELAPLDFGEVVIK